MWILWSFLSILTLVVAQKRIAEVRYEWKYLNYTWSSTEEYNRAILKGDYIPKNNILIGVKVWKNKFYFALSRFKSGVPVTLATASYWPTNGNRSPNLEPFPNWQMQKGNNCKTSLQTVHSIEIDPAGRMWVLNTGRIDIFNNPNKSLCPHRLLIFDLENNGKILLDYEFPKEVVDPNTGYLNDLVLDHTDGGYAYITNSDNVKPSIIIFSLKTMSSWKVTDESMKAKDVEITVKGEKITFTKPGTVNGIALEHADLEENRVLYFTPLSSRQIFYINTSHLKLNKSDISEYVQTLNSTPKTHTTGMTMNSKNELFFGILEENTVAVWNSSEKNYRHAYTDSTIQWIDTYAIDEDGNVWITNNRIPRFFSDKLDLEQVNNWLIRLDRTIHKSYQYYSDGSVPELPIITG